MRIGGQMFFTDYSMSPTELARALEDRGFDSLWVPEHSHIPLTRKSPFPSGGDLPKKYYDVMDPFVTLIEVQKLMYFMQEAGEPPMSLETIGSSV